jgi:hypothetical protein
LFSVVFFCKTADVRPLTELLPVLEFDELLDSSDMGPDDWVKIASTIHENYYDYDGFVCIHGTDTMAYTASALSFMFVNLGKPVILVGSMLPFGEARSTPPSPSAFSLSLMPDCLFILYNALIQAPPPLRCTAMPGATCPSPS